ncbi:MAG: four helix bundle protein [Bacteroidetes bacterium]|nr:four helix bundle protein [Bacteroidota bacterium]MBL7102985.1 four helix bundle protein [Bacteroidales bacterium]
MHNFKELKIWQKSRVLTKKIYLLIKDYPEEEKFGLVSQIRRSAISIPSNIAEGSGRNSDRDFRRFLNIALSSAFELETQIILSFDLDYLLEIDYLKISEEIQEVQKMIFGFRKSLSKVNKSYNFLLSLLF